MDTAGESPVKRVKKTHRGRRSSAGQKKRDQRNEKYYPDAFALAWLTQNYGTASCNVASTSDGGVRSNETERGIVGSGETSPGSPQDGWADAGGANESDGSECEIRLRLVEVLRPGRKRHLELTMDDSDLERLRRATNQRTSIAKILVGATGLGCFVPGQDDFNEDECKKSSDQWRHDLEMRPQWLSWIFDSRIGRVPS